MEEKNADVNQKTKNDTPLIRALFRNNELIVRDLIKWGADMNYKMPNTEFNMPLYAVMRGRAHLLDLMLKMGASMDYSVDKGHVAALLQMQSPEFLEVHFKHRRWRRLRNFLKLEDRIGTGTSTEQKKLMT